MSLLASAKPADAGPFETAVPNWQTGDTLIAAGNVWWRVVSVIPAEKVAEFIDGPNVGIIEVEPLKRLAATFQPRERPTLR
jgi:hypothetical protein